MKTSLRRIFLFLPILGFLAFGCNKEAIDAQDNNIQFDPAKEPDAVLRSLLVNGMFSDEDPVPSDTSKGRNWSLSTLNDTAFAYESVPISLRFAPKAFPAGFVITNFYLEMPPGTGYWDINQNINNGFTLNIPGLVRKGFLNLGVSAKLVKVAAGVRVDSFVTKRVDQVVKLMEVDNCDLTLSGRNKQGLIYRKINLGMNKGKLKISFLSMDSSTSNKTSDRFDLFLKNQYVLSSSISPVSSSYFPTCSGLLSGSQRVQGWKEYTYDYDPVNGTQAELYIQSNCTDTTKGVSWQLKMTCPQ